MKLLAEVETMIDGALCKLERRDRRLSALYSEHCLAFSKLTRLCLLLRVRTGDSVETITDTCSIQCSLLRRIRREVMHTELAYLEGVVSADAVDSACTFISKYHGARIPLRACDVENAVSSLHCDLDRFIDVRVGADGVINVCLRALARYETLGRRMALIRRLRDIFHQLLSVFSVPSCSGAVNERRREFVRSELFYTRLEFKQRVISTLCARLPRDVSASVVAYVL